MKMTDIVKPCRLFAKEMAFQKRLGEKVKKKLRYAGRSFEELLWAAKMPLTVYWKVSNILKVARLATFDSSELPFVFYWYFVNNSLMKRTTRVRRY